jgi:DNA-binding GntR family transcriptional regulator
VRRAAELFTDDDESGATSSLEEWRRARDAGDVGAAVSAHRAYHMSLYESARSSWLLRLIRPAWDSCERYRPALLTAKGDIGARHHAHDDELLAACAAHDPTRAEAALRNHLELASEIYAVELAGRSIFGL